MNNAITLTLSNGATHQLSAAADKRIACVAQTTLVAVSSQAARELVSELRALGLNARSDRKLVAWCSVKGLARRS